MLVAIAAQHSIHHSVPGLMCDPAMSYEWPALAKPLIMMTSWGHEDILGNAADQPGLDGVLPTSRSMSYEWPAFAANHLIMMTSRGMQQTSPGLMACDLPPEA